MSRDFWIGLACSIVIGLVLVAVAVSFAVQLPTPVQREAASGK